MHLKKDKLNLILIMLILAFFSVGCNLSMWGDERGSLTGKVLDSNNVPIVEAKINTYPITKMVITNKYGYFNIDNVKEGDYTVTIFKEGYQTKTISCSVEEGLSFSCFGSNTNTYVELHLILN